MRHPEPLTETYIDGAPDLAVEILSPTDRSSAIATKVSDFLAAGALMVWVVDPRREQVVVHRADGASTTLGAGDTLKCDDVLPGFAYALTDFFEDD